MTKQNSESIAKGPDYISYTIEIANHGGVADSTTIPGNVSVSKAVEYFLRELLKKDDLTVKIEKVSSFREVI